jgi:hypothetical protein
MSRLSHTTWFYHPNSRTYYQRWVKTLQVVTDAFVSLLDPNTPQATFLWNTDTSEGTRLTQPRKAWYGSALVNVRHCVECLRTTTMSWCLMHQATFKPGTHDFDYSLSKRFQQDFTQSRLLQANMGCIFSTQENWKSMIFWGGASHRSWECPKDFTAHQTLSWPILVLS